MSLIPRVFRKLTFKKVIGAVGKVAAPIVHEIPGVGKIEQAAEGIIKKVGKDLKQIEKAPIGHAIEGAYQQVKSDVVKEQTTQAAIPILVALAALFILTKRR